MPITAAPTVRESLEATIESLPEEQPIPAQDAPPAEPSAVAAPEATTAAPAQETEAEKAERLRNKDGTFAKGKPEAKPAVDPAQPVKAKAPRPTSWRKELEPEWDKLTPELQAYVQEREKQYQTGVSTYKGEYDHLEKTVKPMMDAVAPYKPLLDQYRLHQIGMHQQ